MGRIDPRDPSAHRPLRIWLVSQSYLPFHGGITEHVWHLAGELRARGHQVTILTGAPAAHTNARLFSDPPAARQERPPDCDPPGVEVRRWGRTIRVPSNGAQACVTLGWRWRSHVRELRAVPDIVHIQSPLEPCLPLWSLLALPGVKIGTFHTGGDRPHWGYRCFARWLRPAIRRLDARIAVSREAERFVARHFPGDYAVIPNGVDAERFAPVDGAPRDWRAAPQAIGAAAGSKATEILYVGRLDPRKGVDLLLRALESLRKPMSGSCAADARLAIVGAGPELPALERNARERDLPVVFAGDVPRADLARWYRRADVFVAPSTGGESFGISLLEGLAAGLPIIAADISGYRETLQEAPGVRFFNAGSSLSLAKTLHGVLRGGSITRDTLRIQRLPFLQRYSWKTIAEETEALYFRGLESGGRRPFGAAVEER